MEALPEISSDWVRSRSVEAELQALIISKSKSNEARRMVGVMLKFIFVRVGLSVKLFNQFKVNTVLYGQQFISCLRAGGILLNVVGPVASKTRSKCNE